eukprot:9660603-Prorocentrum_lima.AAC.1
MHGLDVLIQVSDLVVAGRWSQEDHMMWYAATLELAWAGKRSPTDSACAPTPKLRPLGQSECLLKAWESAIIDAELAALRAQLEPT